MSPATFSETRRLRSWLVLALLICLLGCSPSGSEEQQAPAQPEVTLTFSDVGPDEEVTSTANSGRLPVRVDVVTSGRGTVRGATGLNGGAVLLPALAEQGAAYAVLRLEATGTSDELSPGPRAFEFGADFALDAASTGTEADNGDNLVQRGLSVDAAQYKIQVDAGRPSCTVAGDSGSTTVSADTLVDFETWYRVRCTRRGDSLSLSVAEIGPDGEVAEAVTAADEGEMGFVAMAAGVPLSVGGKLRGDGGIVQVSTDQFNGLVDQVVYRLLE